MEKFLERFYYVISMCIVISVMVLLVPVIGAIIVAEIVGDKYKLSDDARRGLFILTLIIQVSIIFTYY